jgi:hypothetical protein
MTSQPTATLNLMQEDDLPVSYETTLLQITDNTFSDNRLDWHFPQREKDFGQF